MSDSGPVARILGLQRAWAGQCGIAVDDRGYTARPEANLFRDLEAPTRLEFDRGAGDELNEKMRSLRSSSALAVNVFDTWRNDAARIAHACDAPSGVSGLRFECQFPTGLRGTAPHLDVEFFGSGVRPTAIESKFLEPYDVCRERKAVQDAYVTGQHWDAIPCCGRMIREIHGGNGGFEYLDAAQLLKHILGLTRKYGPGGFRLLYLWYDVGGDQAEAHRREIGRFCALVGADVCVYGRTYQEIWQSLRPTLTERDAAYAHYIEQRYGLGHA